MANSITSKLIAVQAKLKVPKSNRNDFGKYNYRSCEDILESVKPLLIEQGLLLYLSDEMKSENGRNYIKATASVTDGTETLTVTGFAREEETKKGMDGSQVTGASSSYARKYALNGLFCIDDTKDSDATNTHDKDVDPAKKEPAPAKPKITNELVKKATERIAAGETDIYKKTLDAFEMDNSQKAILEKVYTQAINQTKKVA